ncbi:MAG: Holliday junction branch migration protein RuvA [Kiritimatiellae bacterium]|nr:Holliday junction branch migration protein RuvA [Kiritimatiellia bacterium]
MIAYLNGVLAEKDISKVVVECAGVGYEVAIPISTFDRLPAEGEPVKLYTHHEVREDAQLLFGFVSKPEREMFELITTVSGVGPKLALAILSGMTVGDLQLAISQGDAKRLATVKGIGKKTAERLVVELRGKINPIEALANATAETSKEQSAVLRDAMLALTALGMSEETAREKVQRVLEEEPDIRDVEIIIRKSLSGK